MIMHAGALFVHVPAAKFTTNKAAQSGAYMFGFFDFYY